MKAQNEVTTVAYLKRGDVVRPFLGEYYNKSLDSLDWTRTLYSEYWDHTVVGVFEAEIRLVRPYVYARDHFDSNSGLIGVEAYSVPRDSTQPFLIQRRNFST